LQLNATSYENVIPFDRLGNAQQNGERLLAKWFDDGIRTILPEKNEPTRTINFTVDLEILPGLSETKF
ncbi:23582_t:CDS:2, partial [Racocetra persica]